MPRVGGKAVLVDPTVLPPPILIFNTLSVPVLVVLVLVAPVLLLLLLLLFIALLIFVKSVPAASFTAIKLSNESDSTS